MSGVSSLGDVTWVLLYTKPHAEAWAEINLRNQGLSTLFPRVATRSGFGPLFPRYLFAGYQAPSLPKAIRSTLGVLYVVQCGDRPARVPVDVLEEIESRMNENGVVLLDSKKAPDALFARRERERVNALVKLAAAGFRVRSA